MAPRNTPSIPVALSLMPAGKIRVLAITSAKRSSSMPSIPSISEGGVPGYDRSIWYGVLAPAGVPRDVITRLNTALGAAINTPEMKESLNRQGLEPQTNTPEQYAAFIRSEIAQNVKLVKIIGLKAE